MLEMSTAEEGDFYVQPILSRAVGRQKSAKIWDEMFIVPKNYRRILR